MGLRGPGAKPVPLWNRNNKRVASRLFLYGDATWSFYNNPRRGVWTDPVHKDRETAFRHWTKVRHQVWGMQYRFRVPVAATVYDLVIATGFPLLWESWRHPDFPLDEILARFAADRESVAVFRKEDEVGALQVTDYLDVYLQDLAFAESEAIRCAAASSVLLRERPEILSGSRYGDKEAKR